MKKIISFLLVIVAAPIALGFVMSTLFHRKNAGIFSGNELFSLAYADVLPATGESAGEGAGGGASEGTATGGTGADAGGNAAAQGNDSSVGVEGAEGSGGD